MEQDDVSEDSSGSGRRQTQRRVKHRNQPDVIIEIGAGLEEAGVGDEGGNFRRKSSPSILVVEPERVGQVVGGEKLEVERGVSSEQHLLNFATHLEELAESFLELLFLRV